MVMGQQAHPSPSSPCMFPVNKVFNMNFLTLMKNGLFILHLLKSFSQGLQAAYLFNPTRKGWGYSRPLQHLSVCGPAVVVGIKIVGAPQAKPMHGFLPNF